MTLKRYRYLNDNNWFNWFNRNGQNRNKKCFLILWYTCLYDADKAVHNLYGPNKRFRKVKNIFPNCINEDGSVNREILSKEVLDNPEKIKSLEQIIHPLVAEDRKIFFYENLMLKQLSLIYHYCLKLEEKKMLILLLLLTLPIPSKRKEFCLDQT